MLVVLEKLIEQSLPKGSLRQRGRQNKLCYYLKYYDSSGKRIDKYGAERCFSKATTVKKRKKHLEIVKQLKKDSVNE